eukprot:comp22166_c0_seq1/m.32512 comp22166_c0_seq1/g.32512  ORF comp22166_c0_seq1/g.32512 comp22166_c0_seq1/m.32512 type:complete len:370 (-) comp22166_c0_seq1:164-1273(-)
MLSLLRQTSATLPGVVRTASVCRRWYTAPIAAETLTPEFEEILKRLQGGDRAALARSITCVESTRADHRAQAQLMLEKLARSKKTHRHTGTFRIGLSGPPGAGKSTFIEAIGQHITSLGHKLAVLAIDPSSSRTGGSILGDKTRMDTLSINPNAYIRPSASRGTLGGVARNTCEAVVMCEAAGYDIVLIETVGVGQSEVTVADMVDMFVLLMPPAAGDELQGIKRGVMELAQMVMVNKADGDLLPAANRAAAEIISALKILRPINPNWQAEVLSVSARNNKGIADAWNVMMEYRRVMTETGDLERVRAHQRRVHMWNYINQELAEQFRNNQNVQTKLSLFEHQVISGELPAGRAADRLIDAFLRGPDEL